MVIDHVKYSEIIKLLKAKQYIQISKLTLFMIILKE